MSKAFLVHDRQSEVSHRHFCLNICGYPDAYAMYVYGYRIILANTANGLVSPAAAGCLAQSPGPRQGGESGGVGGSPASCHSPPACRTLSSAGLCTYQDYSPFRGVESFDKCVVPYVFPQAKPFILGGSICSKI